MQYAEGVTLPPLIVRVAPSVIGLRRQLLQLIPSGRELAACSPILGVGALIVFESPLRTLESVASGGWPFGWFLGLAIGGAMVATALSAFRFLIVWRDLVMCSSASAPRRSYGLSSGCRPGSPASCTSR